MRLIDTTYDFYLDTPSGKDPDAHSATLRKYNQILWSKPLPGGAEFTLRTDVKGSYLFHDSVLGQFRLSSDMIASTHARRLASFSRQVEGDYSLDLPYTIGAAIVFPGHRIGTDQTINQHRGIHQAIQDRFDLTLECIRRHYLGESSPLGETLNRYASFFALFADFNGYVDFFLLQDLVDDHGDIEFFRPVTPFEGSPLPATLESYIAYRRNVIRFVKARNRRIAGTSEPPTFAERAPSRRRNR
ncbi:DUF6994 family protein [Subtercola boreus]|uniref:DUF6994 family protein n=1 Tax=Subtercola boreus TaxID=120213 RepID=UPI000E29FC5F|nr:hypothetical protein [Subtercola boreus]